MGDNTAISWTDATWNPVVGCKRVSPGCDHCYAFQLHDQRHIAWKRGRMPDAPAQYHLPFSKIQLIEERLALPIRWTRPRRIFTNSLSDLFHPDVPDDFLTKFWAVMACAPQHQFQVLTKRPERMRDWVTSVDQTAIKVAGMNLLVTLPESVRKRVQKNLARVWQWPLPNVWLGTSVEDQERSDERIPLLLQTPAAVRFISAEPLLGPVNLTPFLTREWYSVPKTRNGETYEVARLRPALDWVIVGGESGSRYREMNLNWARQIRDDCIAANGVAFFYKQSSGRRSGMNSALDGVEWHQFPEG